MFRPKARGVRCVLRRGDDVLLVRHTYGDRRWMLPGGRMRRRETPAEAAAREVRQELGVAVSGWRELGAFESSGSYKRDTTYYLEAAAGEHDFGADPGQIGEVRWFRLDGLPEDASPALAAAARAGLLPGGPAPDGL